MLEPTTSEQRAFVLGIIAPTLLDDVLTWIHDTYEASDIYDADYLKDMVVEGKSPEDLFPEEDLNAWALGAGYTRE